MTGRKKEARPHAWQSKLGVMLVYDVKRVRRNYHVLLGYLQHLRNICSASYSSVTPEVVYVIGWYSWDIEQSKKYTLPSEPLS